MKDIFGMLIILLVATAVGTWAASPGAGASFAVPADQPANAGNAADVEGASEQAGVPDGGTEGRSTGEAAANSDVAAVTGEVAAANGSTADSSSAVADGPSPEMVESYRSGVLGSAHDFSEQLGGPADVCRACHVPHINVLRPRAAAKPAGVVPVVPSSDPSAVAPQEEAAATPTLTFEMFRMPGQRRVFREDRYMPGPTSLMCLGCHDGTVATATIGSAHAMLAGVRQGFAVTDDFVWRDHPIGIEYPSDPQEYRSRASVEAAGIPLPEGRIECISCHDPHNERGLDHLLVVSNKGSRLCLTCHVK
jgi:predicted CXXCH cytochrome family protein